MYEQKHLLLQLWDADGSHPSRLGSLLAVKLFTL
jgi:hypothetical protein